MRICRFDEGLLGVVDGGEVVDVTGVLARLPSQTWPYPPGDLFISHFSELRSAIEEAAKSGARKPIEQVRLLSPIGNPGKLIGAPVNYKLHLDEARADSEIHNDTKILTIHECGVFLKANSSLVGPGEGVVSTWADRRIDHEIELAAIIGKPCRNVSKDDALSYVVGYAIGLDMTVRGTEDRSLRKSLDTFSVLGPWMVTADEFGDPSSVDFELKIGEVSRQKANTRDLILNVADLIEYASRAYTLQPGDVIMTGTPEGVGPVDPGDRMDCWIDGIGKMSVSVRAA
ncbi:Ureidoglycolate lyase [Sulfitobacter sp. DSM 110093]|uniref:fumarylacetoacetate hydrolase family protein n=1 Tax=Sulfitobacter sp. DSM 110093 TaxID=2883127 RepID=UPI001FADBB3B|nr:fumarylacetoacetate hydrolase family protein [Sulfitobacter sp. DSM 110093]UOA33297.1 Ureidoglycolate lyase [Sulfitobacter sp. DSM 110093]